MKTGLSEGQIGLILVTASAIAFSTGGFFTRLIDLDVWTVLFWRGVFGGLTILAFIGWQHQRQTLSTFLHIGSDGMAVALCSALATICFINALRQTDVADVLVIGATLPFATATLAWLWIGEREERSTLVACIVAVIGVIVMMSRGLSLSNLIGNLLALLMVLFLAAMLSSPRRPSSTMRIFSSAEKCRRVARRMSLTVSSALCGACLSLCLIVSLLGVTMSRKLSLTQTPQTVR